MQESQIWLPVSANRETCDDDHLLAGLQVRSGRNCCLNMLDHGFECVGEGHEHWVYTPIEAHLFIGPHFGCKSQNRDIRASFGHQACGPAGLGENYDGNHIPISG